MPTPTLPFRIKICGITRPLDAINAFQCGADAIGLNFFEKSKRYVDSRSAQKIVDAIHGIDKTKLLNRIGASSHSTESEAHPIIVGVFVNMPIDEMVAKVDILGLDAIQLHGNESPDILSSLKRGLQKAGLKCSLIRALRVSSGEQENRQKEAILDPVLTEIDQWIASGIDAILLDSAVPGEFGGTGKAIDWTLIPTANEHGPIILAGGLTPENVRQAISEANVQAIDIASGVESSPGIKDHESMKLLVKTAKDAWRTV